MKRNLGTLISGSLTEGFMVRLGSDIEVTELKAGRFVSVSSGKYKFFSLISDLKLEVTNKDILIFPPEPDEILLKKIRTVLSCLNNYRNGNGMTEGQSLLVIV